MDLELQNSPHIISHVLAATTVESKLIGQYDWSTRAQEASHVLLQPPVHTSLGRGLNLQLILVYVTGVSRSACDTGNSNGVDSGGTPGL